MANSAYTQWDNLRKALKNSKIEPNGKIATILLDCFIKLDGKLRVPLFRDKGLCQKSGEFYEMRKKLKSKGWLEFDTDAGGKLIRYYPGKKLIQDKPPNGGSLMLSIVAASVDKWYHKNLTKIS